MIVVLELDTSDRILRVLTGERPAFIGGAAKLAGDKGARTSAAVKHSATATQMQMCHVVAWSILTKKARRTFKGLTLEEADEWLSNPGNWPDGQVLPESLTRRNPSRAMGLQHFSMVTKEFVQQSLEVWLKAVNSWVQNLWLGPAGRNEAKGRMLNHCLNLVKRACFKSEPIHLGSRGTVTCQSGGRPAEIGVERWGIDGERCWLIRQELIEGPLEVFGLVSQGDDVQNFAIIRAGMANQKLQMRNSFGGSQVANAIFLTPSYMYIKVSRQFDWSTYFGMLKGELKLNEKEFGDTPFEIRDFESLENFLLFSAIDLEADVTTSPGTRPSEIPPLFVDGYGHYVDRLRSSQGFNKRT